MWVDTRLSEANFANYLGYFIPVSFIEIMISQ